MSQFLMQSFKWSALAEIASKIIPPIFYIITARILSPDEFGIVASSAMVIAFATIFWEAGLAQSLIQNNEQDIQLKIANIVFYSNIGLSLFIYLLIYFSAEYIALLLNDNRLETVLQVSGISLLIGSAMSVQTALFQKKFQFKELFYSRMVAAIVPGVVSIILALRGYSYWALVFGNIVSIAIQALVLWSLSTWRPSLSYDTAVAKKIFSFSKWVLFSAVLSWFFIWGDVFIIGMFFTSSEVGLYRTGNYFVGAIIGLITMPLVPVLYSYFSSIQNDKPTIKRSLLFSSKSVSLIVLPIGLGLYLAQDIIASIIFGNNWIGISTVIGYLALMHAVSWIIGFNNEAYKAIGKPYVETIILITTLFFYIIIYYLSARIGFDFFIKTRFFLALAAVFIHIVASYMLFNIGLQETFNNIRYILFALVFIFIIDSSLPIGKNYFTTFVLLFLYLIIYLIILYFFDKKFLYQLKVKIKPK